jgi:hypothetical protein
MAQPIIAPSSEQYTVRYRPPIGVPQGGTGTGETWLKIGLGAGALYLLWRAGVFQRLETALHLGPTGTPTGPSGSGAPSSSAPSSPAATPQGSGTSAGPGGTPAPPASPIAKPTAVVLTGPGVVPVGGTITVQAQAYGVGTPVYQFWYYPPGGVPGTATGWASSGPYSLSNRFTLPSPAVAGEYQIVAYARSVNAPTNETAAQRQQYETASNVLFVTVQ